MIRDRFNIIIQPDPEDLNNESKWDGGDSAFSTGIMAGSGSVMDSILLPQFIKNNQLVRHPYQTNNTGDAPHNDPKATSRDQVIAFFFGLTNPNVLGMTFKDLEPVRAACLQYARGWKINKDVLLFAQKLYLYKLAKAEAPLWIVPLAYVQQFFSVLWDCFVNPKHEMNQAVCMNIVFGKFYIRMLLMFHPDLKGNIREYFDGWRTRKEVSALFITRLENAVA